MAEQQGAPTKVGTDNVNAPFVQPSDQGMASINRTLVRLETAISTIAKPPLISTGNLIALASGFLVLLLAAYGGLALSSRIDRVNDAVTHVGDRLSDKLEKINDQLTKMDERTSTLEGQLSGSPATTRRK